LGNLTTQIQAAKSELILLTTINEREGFLITFVFVINTTITSYFAFKIVPIDADTVFWFTRP